MAVDNRETAPSRQKQMQAMFKRHGEEENRVSPKQSSRLYPSHCHRLKRQAVIQPGPQAVQVQQCSSRHSPKADSLHAALPGLELLMAFAYARVQGIDGYPPPTAHRPSPPKPAQDQAHKSSLNSNPGCLFGERVVPFWGHSCRGRTLLLLHLSDEVKYDSGCRTCVTLMVACTAAGRSYS